MTNTDINTNTGMSSGMMTAPRPHLIVMGGTSGMGLALALLHQQQGWQVSVVGHSQHKLDHIRQQHPDISTYHCDLTELASRQALLARLSDIPFLRLIYSAGSYLNERIHRLDKDSSDLMLAINLQAFEHVFMWASEQLKQHLTEPLFDQSVVITQDSVPSVSTISARPSLICIASIAGMMDYPYASLYAKSKRAMIATASAYRCALRPYGIQVTCIASGYVDTQALRDLNHGDASHKPFVISESHAVTHIMQAIADDVALAVFPWQMRHISRVLNRLPKPLLHWILRGKDDK